MPVTFADNFLAGSIISLLFPVLLLVAIAVWYVFGVRRFSGSPPRRGEPPRSDEAP
jgi:hypothetical protein